MSTTSRRNRKLGRKTTRADQRLSVRCPKCRGYVEANGSGVFYCSGCRMEFDDQPDEGGDYSDVNPGVRMERQERRRERRNSR